MEEEISHLRSLDLIGLKIRWQSVVGRPAPEHLPKHLLFGILAYRIQTDVLGDLNAATVQLLKRAAIVQSLSEVLPLVAAHAGWMLVKARYDDGGFSGGSTDRPALQQLLADVAAHRIHIIVVYKVDRLTRSLADFAKLVELFDAHGVSFVSVTQQFNTTTSMGRLTLNVLLSFAQFEREVTSERIRDKIAAPKRKGVWVGGMVPLGYILKDGQLHLHEEEADIVRLIFQRYLELGSVNRLIKDLKERGFKSKIRKLASGGTRGGLPFTQRPLFYMLRNRFYLGEVKFKGEILPGPQPALLDRTLFEAVQQRLTEQWSHRTTTSIRTRALLAGLLFDDAGHRMILTYSSRDRVRHRYYVSAPCIRGQTDEPVGTVTRVPASEIEVAISKAVIANTGNDEPVSNEMLFRETLERFVTRIEVRRNQLLIHLGSTKTIIMGSRATTISIRLNLTRSLRAPSSYPGRSHQGPSERSCCRRIPQSIAPGP